MADIELSDMMSNEVLKNSRNVIPEDDLLIDKESMDNQIKSESPSIVPVFDEQSVSEVKYETKDLIDAYSSYLTALSSIPINYLDKLSDSYTNFYDAFKIINKDILRKLENDLNSSEQDPELIKNDFKDNVGNFGLLIKRIQCIYDFSTALSVNYIGKMLKAYDEYKKVCSEANSQDIGNLAKAYVKYKKISSSFSDEVLTSLNMPRMEQPFLDSYYEDSESLDVIEELDIKENVNTSNKIVYLVSNDVNKVDNYTVIVPAFTSNDFSSLLSSSENEMTQNELCSYGANIICESVKRVVSNLYLEMKRLDQIKKYIEVSPVYVALSDVDKGNVLNFINSQGSIRLELCKVMEKDLVSGWDKINGEIGAALDPTLSTSKDAYGVYEEACKCTNKYVGYFEQIETMYVIMDEINKYGFEIVESNFS